MRGKIAEVTWLTPTNQGFVDISSTITPSALLRELFLCQKDGDIRIIQGRGNLGWELGEYLLQGVDLKLLQLIGSHVCNLHTV